MANEKKEGAKAPSSPPAGSAAPDRRKYSDKLVEIIKENERRKEQRIFQEELAKRIQLARDGRAAYERKDLKTATINYKRFLQLTAKSLNVDLKDMHPKLFDEKIRVSESLLISAIVFDLAKIFDRINGGTAERQQYLRLLVLFTNGMPFQFFVSENLSKYLKYTPNIVNINEFKAAYKAIRKGGWCFIATACFEDANAPEVKRLRQFRDEVLLPSSLGALIVESYYRVSPPIARYLQRHPWARQQVRRVLERVYRKLSESPARCGRSGT